MCNSKECILMAVWTVAFLFIDLFFVWLSLLKRNSCFVIRKYYSKTLFELFKKLGMILKVLCVLVNQLVFFALWIFAYFTSSVK